AADATDDGAPGGQDAVPWKVPGERGQGLFANPSPRPPLRLGEGEQPLSFSPSPLRGGGQGKGLWNSFSLPRSGVPGASPLEELAVSRGLLHVAGPLIIRGEGLMRWQMTRVETEGLVQPAQGVLGGASLEGDHADPVIQ